MCWWRKLPPNHSICYVRCMVTMGGLFRSMLVKWLEGLGLHGGPQAPYGTVYVTADRSNCDRHYLWVVTYLLTYLRNYELICSMKQSPFWEANRFSASQEIARILWNTKVHYHIHKCPPRFPILSHIQSMPSHPTSWISILLFFSHLSLGLPSGLFLSSFPTKTLYTPLPAPMHATCSAHLILLGLMRSRYY